MSCPKVVRIVTPGPPGPGLTLTGPALAGRISGTGTLVPIPLGPNLGIVDGALTLTGAGSGTVTGVGLSVPTGFSVDNFPITGSGTLAISFTSGYSLPTTAKQGQWDQAYADLGQARTPTVHGHAIADVSGLQTALGGKAGTGAIGSSGLTMATARLLGRTTAGAGAVEEIQVSGGTFANGVLTLSGLPSTLAADANGNLTFTARWIQSTNGAASAPPMSLTGTWFTGGTSTTTKPQFLIEPAGTTSASWSTAGTGLGVNAPSEFTGRLIDLQSNGVSRLVLSGNGFFGLGTTSFPSRFSVEHDDVNVATFRGVGNALCEVTNGTGTLRFQILSNNLTLLSATNHSLFLGSNNTVRMHIKAGGGFYIDNGNDYEFGTTTGTKFGTATTQKLAFWAATPVAQPAAVADATDAASVITQLNLALARLRSLGLIAT